jgi:hypothetical protein
MKVVQPCVRLCLEQLEDRIVPSASIDLTYATTTDAKTVSVNYTISGGSLAGQNVSFNIYRSSAYGSLSGAQLIGTATIPGSDNIDLSAGTHTGVKLALTAANGQPVKFLTPNTTLPFIVVVDNLDNSSASFETHVLGVIAHGLEFDPFLIFSDQVPQWETQMAADLQNIDHYDAVIAFNWVRLSILPSPFALTIASNLLYQQVVAEANQLAGQHPGDVVDIHFIGHSRGTVVISEVLQDLVGTTDPALQGGYMEMTLLDPHPANLFYSQFSWASSLPLANQLAVLVTTFEGLVQDPQVVIPSNVDQVEDFDQQTPAGQAGFLLGFLANYNTNLSLAISQLDEFVLNLWGETAASLSNHSGQPIEETNLTNAAYQFGLVGHSEVPLWYLNNVVDPNETFTY